ncbi:MAG: hypothetical protein ACE5FY_00970 [Nitrospiria bacterium]
MPCYKYIFFVMLVFFMTRELSPQTGIPPAYGAGLSATDTIAPVSDAQLPFGEVAVGKISFSEIVTVNNENDFPITISGIQVTGPHASSFSLNLNDGDAPCGGAPRTLTSNSNCTLSLLFKPGSAGIQAAFLNISLMNSIEEKIAFQDITTSGISLYNVATGAVTELTNPEVNQEDRDPSWSPAGRQIVFNRHNQDGSDDIILKNIDGPEEPLLIGRGSTSAWSPDGRRLAFHDKRWGGVSLWNFSLDLINLGSSASGESFNPSWSPSGEELVFRRINPFIFSSNIVKLTIDEVNPSNSEEKDIIFNARTPAWSPDGRTIAYTDNERGIFLHKLNTGSNSQLTFPPSGIQDLHPSWSPDGRMIVFQRSSSDDLIVVNVLNRSLDTTFTLPKGRNPAWSPLLPNLALSLSGTGLSDTTNSPPSPPQLISPDIDADGVPTDVVFRWLNGIDPDGDPVSHDLRVCEDTNFSIGCNESHVTKIDQKTVSFAGIETLGGSTLLFFGAGMFFLKRRSQTVGILLLCGVIIAGVLIGCGGGGGSGSISAGEKKELAQEITGLKTNTPYFWKVIAKDNHGNETASQIRQFTTA